MAGELTSWRPTSAVARVQAAELSEVYHRTELAEAQVVGIAEVTKHAMFEAMTTNLLRRQAEMVAPDGAEHYALLALAGVTEMAQVIAGVRRGR